MSNYSTKLKRLGLAKESVRGTAESSPSVWVAISPESEMEYKTVLKDDETLRGVKSKYAPAPTIKQGEGNIKFPLRASDIGEFFHMLWGDPTSAEQTTVTITENSNDRIDFTEDGGAEVTAQLTAGTYAFGTTSATAGTLCALIKAQMESANGTAATYTVTYSYSTKKFTITKNSGVFVLKWSTGTNTAISAKTTLGFSNADTSSAIAATSDSTTAQPAFLHTFTPGSSLQPQSYTTFLDRSLGVLKYNLCNVSEMKISSAPDDLIMVENKIMFKTEASGSIGSPSYVESEELAFHHTTFKIATTSNTEVKNWEATLMNGLFPKRVTAQSQDPEDMLALENSAKVGFTVYFEDTTERAKFLAGTSTSIEIIIAGDTIAGSITYGVEILLDEVYYKAFPYGEEDTLLAAKVEADAVYNSTNSRIARVRVYNITSSY